MNITPAKDKYTKIAVAEMKKKFSYKSVMAVPRIQKVVVNVGIGKIVKENDKIEEIVTALTAITGQKPVKTKAKKAISGFKIREGMEIGVKVTLRGARMWQFIDRIVAATLPRTRDFQGLNRKAVDTGGNLNIGLKEHMIFPEISPEKVKHTFGMQITVSTNAHTQAEGLELFKLLGFPLKSE
ncbi:MAG: 50S ribosomal protein L5 [Candidatus Moranbacteria bacterium GW2011_GWC2_37_73]|nr:MAG: 50S ribosomal protein L5, large subunit ribosomal protein L5 [Parcubacteria group bacterium GW2011_GWC1_36_108]KKQ00474.1 MAG: 50S ribosomal protein L5 [Candidatus Moranbacteria bacterium GW2011_GWD1_36_198]KKQ01706.1 MAG: 50S ribosomal protein L5 [Candidatus Moranbacteria bacterium GW2011_GWD2_36_198]KKQ39609.1 MAG: 50S ribosomal protein L5 [Candidatus Moranbacteria bacterium GW2011_GWC2_37_73]